MATVIKMQPFQASSLPIARAAPVCLKSYKPICLSFSQKHVSGCSLNHSTKSLRFPSLWSPRFVKFAPLASTGETETTETEEIQEPQVEDSADGTVGMEDGASDDDAAGASDDAAGASDDAEEAASSVILETLQSYKVALANNDDSKAAEIEAFLKSIEDEKIHLESKAAKLSDELSVEKDRILRISADFENFRRRTEKERLSVVTNAQGEVVEKLLQVLDNFERAKSQIKVQTEGEEKINNSYQSIYKQLVEILGSLGVVPVETVGEPFDPLLHEAIMREDSTEFAEGIVIEEYRKGFKLGDRLLRPSMVKVSAGPGPAKSEEVESSSGGERGPDAGETTESSTTEVEAESS